MDYKEYMKPFEEWLTAQGLSRKTMRRTLNRTEAFLDYLAYHSDLDAEDEVPVTNELLSEGERFLGKFFGYYMYHNLLASVGTMGEYAGSVRKLYKWLALNGNVSRETAEGVIKRISSESSVWRENLRDYEADEED